ncbi:MAG TPA: hypothetical protein VF691_16685 [Cytophagaceae bacterium]|jgi:hypothetical protein
MYLFRITLILFIISNVNAFAQLPKTYKIKEVPVYELNTSNTSQVTLYMDYASHSIRNTEDWKAVDTTNTFISKIDLVFTKYPISKTDWITHYDSLQRDRIDALARMDGRVRGKDIIWTFILQTDCKTEIEAKKLFHGAVLTYQKRPPIKVQEVVKIAPPKKLPKRMDEELEVYTIEQLISGRVPFTDSVVLKVFERNPQWEDMLVINDWTGSMYEYGSQVVKWHKDNIDKKRIKNLVFFNDGDGKKQKPIGKTGGIYFIKPDNIKEVIDVMNKVQKNGDGREIEENDVEAIIKGIKKTKHFKDLILIADSRSPVRDLEILNKVTVPVHVVLCGYRPGQAIVQDFFQIAYKTGGTIHTIDEDVTDLKEVKEREKIKISNVEYTLKNGRFLKTRKAVSVLEGSNN